MKTLALHTTQPFNAAEAIEISGPPCVLPDRCCVPLMLCIHELATNAVKYGALSTADGRVSFTWEVVTRSDGLELEVRWAEMGGPPVSRPSRRGLGSRLLRPQSGIVAVKLKYNTEGVVCDFVLADVRLSAD